ncbi:ATP-binding protein [Streptomyces sp. NPDC050848]|uniref:ATP-binding protein n=1 Tax=Streptomyces sp. NPDC050848 TaxID=3155791 RepID=UPI0033E48DB3
MEQIRSLGSVIDAPEHRTSLTLAADERAPGHARSFTRAALIAWGVEDLLDAAVLIVSELTTNAERHGRRPAEPDSRPSSVAWNHDEIRLTLAYQADVVGIEVEDCSPLPPVLRNPSPDATSGRGLLLVAALAELWTACPNNDGSGKRVVALVRRPAPSDVLTKGW